MKKAVIIFTRIPIPGETKTRLQVLLDKEECANIHKAMIKDLRPLCESEEWDVFVYYTPAQNSDLIQMLLPNCCDYRLQSEVEFGERMSNCISEVLKDGYDSCVLIGSDIPGLDAEIIQQAFHILEEKDAVIGATEDQGYYLIGMKELHREFFEKQTYGKGNVFEETVEKIRRCRSSYGTVPTLLDIDEPGDINKYVQECGKEKTQQSTEIWKYVHLLRMKYQSVK